MKKLLMMILVATCAMHFAPKTEDKEVIIEQEPPVIEEQEDGSLPYDDMTALPAETVGAKSKTYMDYRAITNKASNQYKLLQTMTICDDGMIRDADGYIAAALGSAFGEIGARYVFVLEDGRELKIIKADQKQDAHTCEDNIFGLDNWDIIEFIIDSKKMPRWENGYIYGGNFDNCSEYAGDIIYWVRVDEDVIDYSV